MQSFNWRLMLDVFCNPSNWLLIKYTVCIRRIKLWLKVNSFVGFFEKGDQRKVSKMKSVFSTQKAKSWICDWKVRSSHHLRCCEMSNIILGKTRSVKNERRRNELYFQALNRYIITERALWRLSSRTVELSGFIFTFLERTSTICWRLCIEPPENSVCYVLPICHIFGFLAERYLSEKYKTNSKLLVVFCTQRLAGVQSSDNWRAHHLLSENFTSRKRG